MPAVSEKVERELKRIFGENGYRVDRIERKLYSYDVGAIPKLIKPFLPTGIAGAVVRPKSETEVVELVKLARQERLQLVPRGAATSGFGGVLPGEGAVVVDLTAMNRILEIDTGKKAVRVQPGVIWQTLQKEINKQGLDLRIYPTSLPASTVGGWLAQGGSGFGSYEYGPIRDNITSARVVLPTGEVRTFTGRELGDYIADAEGITGIITEVTVLLRDLEPEVHRAIAFRDARSAGQFLQAVSARKLQVWSLTLLNPESIRLKKKLPHRHGHPYEEANPHIEPELPEAYIAMVAYPESRRGIIDQELTQIIKANKGEELSREATEHEWEQRFSPMKLKRIGPSIIPTEALVPFASFADVMEEIDRKIKHPFILEGMATAGDKIVLLGFIPHDERKFAFNLAFGLALSVIEIAKKHGGSVYATGLFFRHEARNVLGSERYQALVNFKKKIDPQGIMNPNKVIGSGTINTLMSIASTFEPLVRVVANAARVNFGDGADRTKEINGIPGSVAFFATACARCGYCVPTCEQYLGRGWESHSPRGKYAFIREVLAGREKFTQEMVDRFLLCTTCELCNIRCQLNLPVEHNWMEMRGKLVHEEKRMTFPPFEMMAASLRGEKNIWAGKREHRADWLPADIKAKIKDKAEIMYFAGCTASYVNTDVAEATVRLLDKAGIEFTYMGTDEACCGIPMKVSGKWDVFEEIFRHNVAEARKRGVKTVVTSCPACALVWKELYPNLAAELGVPYEFEVKHYSEVAAEALAAGKLKFDHEVKARVAFHDSCHMGRAQGVYEPPRQLIQAIPGVELVEMEHNRENGYCCGSVLTLIGEMPVAPKLGGMRIQEAIDVNAEALLALCPCCQVQLRNSAKHNDMDIAITDLARFVAKGLGYEIEDKTGASLEAWGIFEKFIILMYPENMAKLMASLFPQMFANMPPGMVPMMKLMKLIPGGLSLMARMMPVMMPLLVPGVMPKVMPDMIKEVARRVGPLPKDMEELMPDLLPKTMEALMPNILPQIVPYVTPMMIEYIKTGQIPDTRMCLELSGLLKDPKGCMEAAKSHKA
ncbi:FAD-binding and (Fe-S)-binding domain-containing protein [Carboxydocella sp. ULO1]|uniref:FAD-binding and (Fe-S)-binding domain-containing protein n=1 Tax=Carboxydocella sp. ULO1 TaxID=1926599 RepID=UPI0009AF0ADD|nr:FAD-binding and (Fe-S)-binding domain-containing protein [Carboxydocella sp. ULO1]GAW27720.1 Fe-S oxidoreductase [Carboxydocella sp. ULO1]